MASASSVLVQGIRPSQLDGADPMAKPGRNDPCPCGSGKKYKNCCLAKDEAAERERLAEAQAAARRARRRRVACELVS